MDNDSANENALFVDVDGVISCFGIRGEQSSTRQIDVEIELPEDTSSISFTDKCSSGGTAIIPAFLPAGIEDRLISLDASCKIIWCTSWFATANLLLESMGVDIGPFEVLHFDDSKIRPILARAETEGFQRWAFIDDEIGHELSKLPRSFRCPDNGMLLETDPEVGMKDEDVARILGFFGY